MCLSVLECCRRSHRSVVDLVRFGNVEVKPSIVQIQGSGCLVVHVSSIRSDEEAGKRSVVVGVLGYYEHSRGAKIGVWCVCMRFGGN